MVFEKLAILIACPFKNNALVHNETARFVRLTQLRRKENEIVYYDEYSNGL